MRSPTSLPPLAFPGVMAGFLTIAVASLSLAQRGPKPEPRLPGAVESAPAWLKGTPFDVAKFFAMPPAAENAAPLYLEALAEFSGDVADCFPPDRRAVAVAGGERWKAWSPTYEAWLKDPASVPHARIDAMLADFKEGFRKLDLAQRRLRCVFATAVTYDAHLLHAQAARQAVRLLVVRGLRATDRGEFDGAIADVGKILRLSRDLRPRGPMMSQVVSVALDYFCCESLVRPLLARKGLKPDHCDKLLKLLAEHEAKALEPFVTAAQSEYVMFRVVLRSVDEGLLTTTGPDGRAAEVQLDGPGKERVLVDVCRMLGNNPDPAKVAGLKLLEPTSLAGNRKSCDDTFKAMLSAPPTYTGRMARDKEREKAFASDTTPGLLRLLAPEFSIMALSASRDLAYIDATRCLLALRRWELTHKKPPVDLAEACKAAGMPGVPADPFSDAPLKLTEIGGESVVYSVGIDGVDDRGVKDAGWGKNPEGDFLFRLPRRQ